MPHETHDKTLPPVDVCGTVPPTEVASVLGVARITSIGGITPGPSFTLSPYAANPVTNYTLTRVNYGGHLDRGNDFGQCEALASGTYERIVRYELEPHPSPPPSGNSGCMGGLGSLLWAIGNLFRKEKPVWERGTFTVTVKLTINPPNPPQYTPAAVQVARGAPGPAVDVQVKVTPPCRYDIVFSHNDELVPHLIVSPTMLTTDVNGEGVVQVRDGINQPRGPITVKGTINSHTPCQGSPVIGTFMVTVM